MRAEDYLGELAPRGIRLGLDVTRQLMEAFPEALKVPAVLIAGTNGKGSTSAILESILRAAGYKTGLYTSPHLENVEEQIRLHGEPLTSDELSDALDEVRGAAERAGVADEVTVFEVMTVAALRTFARAGVDLAVVEAGLGGARDATNVLNPLVSVVTTVSRDHEALLGTTLGKIARDKAGVFRAERPAIWGWAHTQAETMLENCAYDVGALPIAARMETRSISREEVDGRQEIHVETRLEKYNVNLPLAGGHQAYNLALAILVTESLTKRGFENLDVEAVEKGASTCVWPGRLETLRGESGRPVILDAAHNSLGAKTLAIWLSEQKEPYDLLFGSLRSKDAFTMLSRLGPQARQIILTAPLDPRALDPMEFLEEVREDPRGIGPRRLWDQLPPIEVEDLEKAIRRAHHEETVPLVVAGSLRLVGDVRQRLQPSQEPAGGDAGEPSE